MADEDTIETLIELRDDFEKRAELYRTDSKETSDQHDRRSYADRAYGLELAKESVEAKIESLKD